jgi:hypothetical protein
VVVKEGHQLGLALEHDLRVHPGSVRCDVHACGVELQVGQPESA